MTNFNINKNNSLMALQKLVEQNINIKLDYMPESFNKQQAQALVLFKNRLFLEKTIDEAITFNKSLSFPNENRNLQLATTAENLIEVFKLRSDVFTSINYQEEFPDTIKGLNFDKYDSNSAIIFYKNEKMITGTIRVIFDFYDNLPSETQFPFDEIRLKYNMICEISRLTVKKETKGLSLEFKYLMNGIHNIFNNNNLDISIFGIKKEHFKLYSKLGGVRLLQELDSYGTFNTPCFIVSWDLSQVTPFFKKAFLGKKLNS